ncbi:hypothetical protein [Paenibacillus gyeongsangnamensis]|uniref:hypothetical protein n=1 Tax=Paenibacillus gyeongsangnamensis TaxID=3388067 RepID=UPI0022B93567|nr:hypothetical protein [Paenibacillus filicis]
MSMVLLRLYSITKVIMRSVDDHDFQEKQKRQPADRLGGVQQKVWRQGLNPRTNRLSAKWIEDDEKSVVQRL